MKQQIECMTEAALEKETKQLRELVRNREATIVQANRLADLERAIKRIRAVASGRAW